MLSNRPAVDACLGAAGTLSLTFLLPPSPSDGGHMSCFKFSFHSRSLKNSFSFSKSELYWVEPGRMAGVCGLEASNCHFAVVFALNLSSSNDSVPPCLQKTDTTLTFSEKKAGGLSPCIRPASEPPLPTRCSHC